MSRAVDAAEQLDRYGGQPVDERFNKVLEILSSMNDDTAYLREPEDVVNEAWITARLIIEIAMSYKHEGE